MHLITNRMCVELSRKFTFACFDKSWINVCVYACVCVCACVCARVCGG